MMNIYTPNIINIGTTEEKISRLVLNKLWKTNRTRPGILIWEFKKKNGVGGTFKCERSNQTNEKN